MGAGIAELRMLAREGIRGGRLVEGCQHTVYAGKGSGQQRCACCGQTITFSQVEYEVECDCAEKRMGLLSMHLDCYDAWRAESGSKVVTRWKLRALSASSP